MPKKRTKGRAQNGLTGKQVETLRMQLVNRLQKLEEEAANEVPVMLGPHSDLADAADCHTQFHLAKSLRSRRQDEIKLITAALQRIAERTYGVCCGADHNLDSEECTGLIEFQRLEAYPMAITCEHCIREERQAAKAAAAARSSRVVPGLA